GSDFAGTRAVAAAACASAGFRLHALPVDVLPPAGAELETLRRIWEREAVLGSCALLVEAELLDAGDSARQATLSRFVDRVGGAVLVSTREPLRTLNRSTVRLDVAQPVPDEQRQLWLDLLGSQARGVEGQIDRLVAQFNLSTQSLRAAGAQVLGERESDHSLATVLWDACRTQARTRLSDLAQRIEPAASWDDLVLPDPQRQVLHDIAQQVRERTTVYERWGFAARSAR